MEEFEGVRALRSAVSALHGELAADDPAAKRLTDSVVRPLNDLLGAGSGDDPAPVMTSWELAVRATELAAAHPDVPALAEATAALQDLAIEAVPELERPAKLDELRKLQAGVEPGIQLAPNGPYLVANAENLRDALGRPLATRPRMALCRCGASDRKPFCDGSHARIGFTDAKSPDRVPDRRDTYIGQQVTVYDNRGICQHSGFCTDRLATVFRQGTDPFVAPSGGRMDEIIRAVRDCPSGALSFAVDDVEQRATVDRHGARPAAIEVTQDGPYRITGGLPLRDGDGADVARNAGSSREHYALCRCGQSQNKPFCSGMHWYVDFKDPVADPDAVPTMFEWAGGYPAFLRLTRTFYEKYIPQDPLLAPVFARMAADHPERVASWLSEVFCGPKHYSSGYGGYERMLSQHIGKGITEQMRARWVELLMRSAHDAGLPDDPEFRSVFGSYIEWGSRLAVENSATAAHPPEHMPMPHWDWNTSAGAPGSRPSSAPTQTATPETPAVLPADGEPVGFDKHIRTMFRRMDRQSMLFAFDLWSVDDVRTHAAAIKARLDAGTMPCDGAWPRTWIDVFDRWTSSGMAG